MRYSSALPVLLALASLTACGAASDGDPDEALPSVAQEAKGGGAPPTIDPARELMITDLSVVEDPTRTVATTALPSAAAPWTFGRLVQQMAGDHDASDFVLHLLESWETDQALNGFTATARPSIRTLVIEPWLRKSGGTKLDFRFAPFRLLAIVNRLDLRDTLGGKHNLDAGEGRFVFGVLDEAGNKLPFTVIFEYEQPAAKGKDIQAWAESWHALGSLPFGPGYNQALQAITSAFAGPNCPDKPNKSCLNQIRTNDAALAADGTDPNLSTGKLWELREFHLSSSTGYLEPHTTKQTPDESLNGSSPLSSFLRANAAGILANTQPLPSTMTAAANVAPTGHVWNAPGAVNPEVRFQFAVNTCNGCHTTETNTRFLHVKTRAAGQPAGLSTFLTGGTAVDPVTGQTRSFGDLAKRASDLAYVLTADPKALEGKTKKVKSH